jgi:hypothetical protein
VILGYRIINPLLSRLLGLRAEMPDTVEIGLAVVTYLAYLQSQYGTF